MSVCTGTCVQVVLTSCMMNMYKHSLYFLLSFSSSLFFLIAPLSDSSRFTISVFLSFLSGNLFCLKWSQTYVFLQSNMAWNSWSSVCQSCQVVCYYAMKQPLKQAVLSPLKVIPESSFFFLPRCKCKFGDASDTMLSLLQGLELCGIQQIFDGQNHRSKAPEVHRSMAVTARWTWKRANHIGAILAHRWIWTNPRVVHAVLAAESGWI